MLCDCCGGDIEIGDWPFCHGDPAEHGQPYGMLGGFKERIDEMIAPPPSDNFKIVGGPEWVKKDGKEGWKLTSLADKKRLMRLNKVQEY